MMVSGDIGFSGNLPSRFPVFPLTGAILLPGGNLPLNIFEPRYLDMTRDAMRTDRMIGMVQPNGRGQPDRPALYPIGCVGKITSFAETEDGRYEITLTGISRFEILEELEVDTSYRQVHADYSRWQEDLNPGNVGDNVRPRLIKALKRYFEVHEISVDWGQIEAAPLSGLLTSLAMICPFEPCEKQALLETSCPDQLGQTLITLLQMGVAGDDCCARH
jgi:Lon protease-like protein